MTHQAIFRFYEELNDFLPSDKKDIAFIHSFNGTPSIKDTIEAIGVPHVEVHLIQVNDNAVDLTYRLKENDIVSVYPKSGILKTPNFPFKFILDVHLGKLAKYLRICGFDTLYQNDLDDKEIIRISLDENRIILTRDIGLLKVKSVSLGYFVRTQNSKDQLTEVLTRFNLRQQINPFSRCIKCNGNLVEIEKDKIVQELEPLTQKYFNKFFRCLNCKSIYWEGSHFDHMNAFIYKIKNSEH